MFTRPQVDSIVNRMVYDLYFAMLDEVEDIAYKADYVITALEQRVEELEGALYAANLKFGQMDAHANPNVDASSSNN